MVISLPRIVSGLMGGGVVYGVCPERPDACSCGCGCLRRGGTTASLLRWFACCLLSLLSAQPAGVSGELEPEELSLQTLRLPSMLATGVLIGFALRPPPVAVLPPLRPSPPPPPAKDRRFRGWKAAMASARSWFSSSEEAEDSEDEEEEEEGRSREDARRGCSACGDGGRDGE